MSSKPRYLTKSRFKSALECPTKLYYYGKAEYANLMSDDDFMQALCEGGYQVGELAKYYFPGGDDVKSLDYDESLAETNKLLQQENVIIYEAAIQYEHTFIRVDVLKKEGKRIELIEVKAKSFKSIEEFTNASGEHIDRGWYPYLADVAFQTWVMKHAFPDYEIEPFLMLTDKNKKATVDGLNQLFRINRDERDRLEVSPSKVITPDILGDPILAQIKVTEFVRKIMRGEDFTQSKKSEEELKSFEDRIIEYGDIYTRDAKYPVAIGLKCKSCEYKNTKQPDKKSGFHECWKEQLGEEYDPSAKHIFEIWNFRKSAKLIEDRIFTFTDLYALPDPGGLLNERQLLQVVKETTSDLSEHMDPGLRNEMNSWTFPLHFIDFETSMVALPFTKGRKPYEQTAFQFSCHTLHDDGRIEHHEWIDTNQGVFPNYEFVKQLKKVLDKDEGTIFRYAAHENTVLNQIKTQMLEDSKIAYGDLIEWLETVTEWKVDGAKVKGPRNMVDMLQLVRKYYYHPDMKGSNSIKAVLPAVMAAGEGIRIKYSKPLNFGTHLKGRILFELDPDIGKPMNPYHLLPNQYGDLDMHKDELILEDVEIQEGGAALMAYGKMQFTEMTNEERGALTRALLQYCELDTLAMVMIYEHWKGVVNEKIGS